MGATGPAADLTEPEPLHLVLEEFAGCLEEAGGVGQGCVEIEGGFVNPLGMDRENDGFADGLEDIDSEATRLVAGGYVDAEEFVAELRFLAGQRFEANDEMEGHNVTVSRFLR